MDIPILFENDDVLVINKPEGIMAHPDGFHTEKTIAEWFIDTFPDAKGVGEKQVDKNGIELERSGVVHRLDRETSGVLILAKTQDAYMHLKKQFHDRHAQKEYRAFVYGTMREQWGVIDRPIGRSAKNFRMRSAQRGAKGTLRDAQTQWERIGTGRYLDEDFTYLKLMPKTGRTHQIRVHLRAIERPVVRDPLYAAHKIDKSNNLDLQRMALHAHILEILLPNMQMERFVAPLPQVFEEAAERIIQEA